MIKKTAFLISLLLSAGAQAGGIDTTGAWDGATSTHAWGAQSTATYGQTFTTAADATRLASFTFYMEPLSANYQAYVARWDGAKALDILWTSAVLSADTGQVGFQAFKVDTGALQLSAATQYVAFFTTSGVANSSAAENSWAYIPADAYAGGGFVYSNSGEDVARLTSEPWDSAKWSTTPQNDLAFSAEFIASVPEPASYGMLLAGLGLLAFAARRKTA